jgi:hypothetical protein
LGGDVAERAISAAFQLVRYLGHAAGNDLMAELTGLIGAVHMGLGQCPHQFPFSVAVSTRVTVCQRMRGIRRQHRSHLVAN